MTHLRLWKEANGYDVSDRTMYRYLNDLNQLMGAKWGEKLDVVQVKHKRKHWQISPLTSPEQLAQATAPALAPVTDHPFGSKLGDTGNDEQRELFLSAVEAHAKLRVLQGIPPSVTDLRQDDVLWPLQLVTHQKNECACVLNQLTGNIEIIALESLPVLVFEGRPFDPATARNRLRSYFENHFGLSENVDENIYQIELLVAEPLVSNLTSRHWHINQSFERVQNGRVKMHLACGINNELVSWILSHGSQMQVLAPEVLKLEILRQLKQSLATYSGAGKGLLQIAS